MVDLVRKEILRLSQEEGLFDPQIASVLGLSRVTVFRVRKECNIPKANVMMKKDKKYVCGECGKTVIIRRCEDKKIVCDDCLQKYIRGEH